MWEEIKIYVLKVNENPPEFRVSHIADTDGHNIKQVVWKES